MAKKEIVHGKSKVTKWKIRIFCHYCRVENFFSLDYLERIACKKCEGWLGEIKQ